MRALLIGFLLLILPFSANGASEIYNDWTTTCREKGCRTYTSTQVRLYEDTKEPSLILLEIDERSDVVVSALVSWQKFQRFYTTNPETELRRDDTRYVADMDFFQTSRPATLSVDDNAIIQMSAADDAHLIANATQELLQRFRDGLEATVTGKGFCAAPGCESQTLTFSLVGFIKAYAARTTNEADYEQNGKDTPDARKLVAEALPENKFGIKQFHLRAMKNPNGDGVFVYIPRIEIAGYERYFVWFVKRDKAFALNGPAITATPDLQRPQAAGYEVWQGTGLSKSNVTDQAMRVVYGQ